MPADRGLAHSKFACESNLGFSTQDNSLQKPSVVIRECLQGQPCCTRLLPNRYPPRDSLIHKSASQPRGNGYQNGFPRDNARSAHNTPGREGTRQAGRPVRRRIVPTPQEHAQGRRTRSPPTSRATTNRRVDTGMLGCVERMPARLRLRGARVPTAGPEILYPQVLAGSAAYSGLQASLRPPDEQDHIAFSQLRKRHQYPQATEQSRFSRRFHNCQTYCGRLAAATAT